MPVNLERSLRYDHSPKRPGEFEQMDAELWNTAMVDRSAHKRGIEQARKEAVGSGKVTEMLSKREGPPEA